MGGKPRAPSAKSVIRALRKRANRQTRDGMRNYGIPSATALGVTVGDLKRYASELGRNHALAAALWKSGIYEARMLAAFIGDPAELTIVGMNRWVKDFDSWAIVDAVCFHLFDRSPLAWGRVPVWANAKPEFEKRAAFALLWGLSVHDKSSGIAPFVAGLALIEEAASDDRHFVKKSVDMALRAIGKRSAELNEASLELAATLAKSEDATRRWIGKNAARELGSDTVQKRIERLQVKMDERTPR